MASPKAHEHTCVLFLEAGCADPDDCIAASFAMGYMTEPRNVFTKLVIVCVGMDNPDQIANIIAKCLAASNRGGAVMNLGDIYLVTANSVKGGPCFEYGADWVGPIDEMKNLEGRITGKISMLIAGPLVGVDMDDFIDWESSSLHACVFVGSEPYNTDDRAEVMTNIEFLEKKMDSRGIVYLPTNFMRAQPLTMQYLNAHDNPVLTDLYVNATTKYLLKERPVHLAPALQTDIAYANLRSLTAMCECWPKDTVRPADSMNDPAFVKLGLMYSKRTDFGKDRNQSISDIPGMDVAALGATRAYLAETTAKIFTCQAFINTLGFTAEAAATPEEGLVRYMNKLPKGADMPLIPFYKGIGFVVLCLMSRETSNGLMYKSFQNAFSRTKCPEHERYPMEVMQHMIHFELMKF